MGGIAVIRHICILLCITMVLGMVAGCSTKPSANPDLDNSAKDKAKPDSKSADLLHDTGKINKDVVRGNMDFAFNIFRQFNREDRENNIFISPLSISTVLAMTYQGAQGATRESMARALGYSGIDISVLNESYKNLLRHLMKLDEKIQLNIENSVWIRDGKPVEEDFLTVNKDIFRAQVETLDFSNDQAIEVINEWVSHATNGKINKILEPPIAPDTIMYLINAIYFNGDWSEKFDKDRT